MTLCDYMLIPVDALEIDFAWMEYPNRIPGYGDRSWCRIEWFIFQLLVDMQGREMTLYIVGSQTEKRQGPGVGPWVNHQVKQVCGSPSTLTWNY